MKVIRPIDVSDAQLIATNVPENDHGLWNAGTTYAAGDFVISTTTHTVYRSLTASNLNNDPDLEQVALADPLIADPDPINWQVISATNRYKAFDKRPSQLATQSDSISYTIQPDDFAGGLAAFGISAESVTITVNDGATEVYSTTIALTDETVVIDWYSYFFSPIEQLTEFALTDLPPYPGAEITVLFERTGGTVSVGQVAVGAVWTVGINRIEGSGFKGLDFSYVDVNEFGDLETIQRPATRLADYAVLIPNAQLLAFESRMRSLRGGVPAVWIGTEDNTRAAINYGFYRDYRAAYQTTDLSLITIEVQGTV